MTEPVREVRVRVTDSGAPLVSIVIPFLNPGRFFAPAIESVLAQTWPHWEILFVDDGSSDGSSELARSYASQIPGKIYYLEHEGRRNRGSSSSRNLGIGQARGEFLAFLDADDIWLPEKLEHQIALMKEHPMAGMVYGPALIWYSWEQDSEHRVRDWYRRLGVEPDCLVQPPQLVELYLREEAETPATCSVLMRRSEVEKTGGFEADFPGMYDDQVFFYKFCLRFPVYIESGSWDQYRQHASSSCHAAIRRGFYDPDLPNPAHQIFLKWFRLYLEREALKIPSVQDALTAAEWPYRNPGAHRRALALARLKKRIRRMVRIVLSRRSYDSLRKFGRSMAGPTG